MVQRREALLLVAHSGHELLLYGWIAQSRPVVHVLTGSGSASASRLNLTAELLREAGAEQGTIFGRLTDQEAYAMIIDRNIPLLVSLVADLAEDIRKRAPKTVVTDATEGYNPVHDLCRLIAGAAIEMADVDTKHYEYSVVNHPDAFDPLTSEVIGFDLDGTLHAAKIDRALKHAAVVPDVTELLSRYGSAAYRRETFRRVTEWADSGSELSEPPLYERFGEERVAAQRYAQVIRRAEHMVPLRDGLREAVEKRSCAF